MPFNVETFSNSWAILFVLLFFGGSIFVHELGHFLAAKMRGLKVLRFSIGFGPAIFSWRGRDGCDYMICLLPLGGYVALPQLADMGALEGGDPDDIKRCAKLPKASFTDKVVVSAAGAFFNVLLAALLALIVQWIGLPVSDSESSTTVGYVPKYITNIEGKKIESPAHKAGIKAGDKIIKIDGVKVADFMQIIERIAIGSGRTDDGTPKAKIELIRDGKTINLDVFPELIKTNISAGDKIRMIGISPSMKMVVASIMENSPAMRGGIKIGDVVASINDIELFSNLQLSEYLSKVEVGKSIKLGVIRDGQKVELNLTPQKVILTKSLCELTLPDGYGKISFMGISSPNSNIETIKVFEVDASYPKFEKIKPGDILYQICNKKIAKITQLNALINAGAGNTGGIMSFADSNINIKSVYFPAPSTSKMLEPQSKMMLGYTLKNITSVKHPSIIQQFSDSLERTYTSLASLLHPQSDVGISSLAGPVDIGRVIYKLSLSDIALMLSFAVLLNINLAILNMLPIPVLDGGHIVIAFIEKIRGKPLPKSFFVGIQTVFSLLFLCLMGYVVYLGFLRWSGDSEYENSAAQTSGYYLKNISFKNDE